jgi:hypothetical protein
LKEQHYIARFRNGHIHLSAKLKGGLVEASHILQESGSHAEYGEMWMLQLAKTPMYGISQECYDIPFNCLRYEECKAIEIEDVSVKHPFLN